MTVLAFPDTTGQPTDGSFQYTANGVIYSWNGSYWAANNQQGFDQRYVNADGDQMTGDLTVPSLNGGPLAGLRNQLINGDFRFWARGTNGTVDGAGNLAYYAPDRWRVGGTASATVSRFEVGDLGAKFPFTYGVVMSAAGQYQQNIELTTTGRAGSFQKGSVWTLSFWTRNALSEASIQHARFAANGTTAGSSWSMNPLEEIDTVDIWRRLSTTITCNQDVGASDVMVNLAIAFNTSSTLTGVQLEPGPVATPWEARPIGTELALCQRYYLGKGNGYKFPATDTTTTTHYTLCPPVDMRAAPTIEGLVTSWGTTVSTSIDSFNNRHFVFVGYQGGVGGPGNAYTGLAINFALDAEL